MTPATPAPRPADPPLAVEPLEDRFHPSATPAPLLLADPATVGTAAVLAPISPPAAETYTARPAAAVAGTTPTIVVPAAPAADGPHRRELLLVEFDVPDRDALVADLLAEPRPGAERDVVELRGGGVAEVTALLRGLRGFDAIHLVSHGSAGALDLGADTLDTDSLPARAADLRAWGAALNPGGDLLLYGCDVAAGPGAAFLAALRAATGADVAASTDATGSPALGADWTLEAAAGRVETPALAAPAGWAHTLGSDLLFVTKGDVSGAGTAGLSAWAGGDVLRLGGSNLATEPGTSGGTVSAAFDLRRFGGGSAGVDGLHLVQHAVTVGTGTATLLVLPGDLILSADHDATLAGTTGSIRVKDDDVFVFRPTVAGDYSAGSFFKLLDNFKAVTGGSKTGGIVLVETDTRVGDAVLPQGTFLYTRNGGSRDDTVYLFTPTGVGVGRTAGSTTVLISPANSTSSYPPIRGLDLVEDATTVGGRALAAGTLLMSLDNTARVGTNALAVTAHDVFALAVTKTTLVNGSTVATASLLFQGADAGLSSSGSAFQAVALGPAVGNRPPVAAPDAYPVTGPVLAIAAPGLLSNDTDPDGNQVSVQGHTNPAHGTVAVNGDGSFVYTPAAGYGGADGFTYTVGDGRGATATGTVTLTVVRYNHQPVATDDAYTTAVRPSFLSPAAGLFAPGVLANDTDADGDDLTAELVSGPAHGFLTLFPGGGLIYTAIPLYTGIDTFTYRVFDGSEWSTPATVSITVSNPNRAPVAAADGYTTAEGAPLVVPAGGVLGNDFDPDGDTLAAVVDVRPAHGRLQFHPDGSFVYTPAAGWHGPDAFTYHATDGSLDSATVTVNLTVAAVNHPPAAADDAYAAARGATLRVPAGRGVLANDADADNDPLAAAVAARPTQGTLVLAADGAFEYTPDAGFYGTDSFTYRASDGTAYSAAATVTIVVPAPPAAEDDFYTLPARGPLAVPAAGVLANDTGTGAGPLAARLVSGPDHGRLTLQADGSFTYVPGPEFPGTDSFTYRAADAGGVVGTARVTITGTRANRSPVGRGATVETRAGVEYQSATPGVLARASDPDGDALTAELVAGGGHGRVTLAGDGSFTYTPDPGFVGTDSFTYRVSDGALASGPIAVTITVTAPATTPPVSPTTPVDPTPRTPDPIAPAPTTPTAAGGTPARSAGGIVNLGGPLGTTILPAVVAGPVLTAAVGTVSAGNAATGGGLADRGTGGGDAGRVFGPADAAAGAGPAPAENRVEPSPEPPAPPSPQPAAVAAGPTLPPAPPAPLAAPAAPPAPPPAGELVPSDAVLAQLDQIRSDLRAEAAGRATADTIVVSGGVAVAGYVLLNTRAVYWFLSALLARPAVWRRFDPLEVVYAWERENAGKARGPDAEDSLQTIVG